MLLPFQVPARAASRVSVRNLGLPSHKVWVAVNQPCICETAAAAIPMIHAILHPLQCTAASQQCSSVCDSHAKKKPNNCNAWQLGYASSVMVTRCLSSLTSFLRRRGLGCREGDESIFGAKVGSKDIHPRNSWPHTSIRSPAVFCRPGNV